MNRRDFIKTSLVAGGAIFISDYASLAEIMAGAAKAGISDSEVKGMIFNIRYVTEIINPPKGGGALDLWVPLPQSDQEQEITELSIRSPIAFHINEEGQYGNKMIHVGAPELKAGDTITTSYKIRRKTAKTVKDDDDVKKHLVLTEREQSDDDIIQFTNQVIGNEKNPLEIGKRVYYALADMLTYDKEIPGCGQGISVWTFRNKRGRCDDFHALFRTIMISKGVPVRWEQGIALKYPSVITKSEEFEGDCTNAHCWVRFYIGDGKWFPVDVSEATKRKDLRDYFFGTISPNRFKVSTGRDIMLRPPQGGDPLNTFPYAYAEGDGIPLIYGFHYKNTIRYELLNIEV